MSEESIEMKKLLCLVLALLMAVAVFAGCAAAPQESGESSHEPSQSAEVSEEPSASTSADAQEETKTITDISGAEVTIPAKVERVVNLWPSSNSVMLAMGAGELLVGTMDFTKSLPWSQFVYPEIVDVPTATDNAEELLAMEPDLVITSDPEQAETFRNAGLPAINLMFSDYDSMKQAFTILGDALGGEYVEKAAKWCQMVDEDIAEVTEAMSGLTEEEKPVVYYIQGQSNQGLYATFAADSIMNDWVTNAGGIFASTLLNLEGTQAQAEEVLALDPDIVIIGGPAQHELYDELMADPAWQEIKAVKNDRVYKNPNGLFPWERFGMESALQILWSAQTIHPELFEVDMVAELQSFYKDFVGVELTEEQANYMLQGLDPDGGISFQG